MSTPEDLRDEAREELHRARRGTIDVDFTVDCESFTVPKMYGLEFSATYKASGTVWPDRSGDHITPNGPPEVCVSLDDLTEYTIKLGGFEDLPKWLEQHLATHFASEMDAAFLEAIGGQERLDELAIEASL